MWRSGLASITFRKCSPRQIVDWVARAGLEGVEWGGDVHVPHGRTDVAREVGSLTVGAGLRVASYGSYYRAGVTRDIRPEAVLDTALALGAPLVRVWAGDRGSAQADAACREQVILDSRALAAAAADRGLRVAYEFHRNTLTDTTDSTLALLREVGHPNLGTYWQPPTGLTYDELATSLERVLPHLAHLHVFQWSATGERRPLAEGAARWSRLWRVAAARPDHDGFAMIEFVRGDDPAAFAEDAAVLRAWLRAAGSGTA